MEKQRNVLDAVFGAPEEHVDTFVDAMKDLQLVIDSDKMSKIVSGRPDAVKAPELTEQVNGQVRINHGWHDGDYVWHISPARAMRPWRASLERVIYAIAQTMNSVIPNTVSVRIWTPYADWDIPEITFKASNLNDEWSVTEKSIDSLNQELFKVLNTLV